jgi:hypothetical protein
MAYNITTTAGAAITTVADGTVNSSATSLTLIGKNYAGYGIFLNENYVGLLEHFAATTAPTAPLTGQLWYDSANQVLKVYNGSAWKPLSTSNSTSSTPSTAITGDLWWDTTNSQLKAYSGTEWVVVGPAFTASTGQSGALVETVIDSGSASHIIIKFYITSIVVAIISKDATFTPQTPISGFTTIVPGMNLISASVITGAQFTGDVSNALTVGGISSSQFLRSDIADQIDAKLTVNSDNGLVVGADTDFTVNVASGTSAVEMFQNVSNNDFNLYVNKGGAKTQVINLDGATGAVILAQTNTSTTTTSGALQVGGGVGIAENLNVGGVTKVTASTAATNKTTGAVVISGGVGIAGAVFADTLETTGNLTVGGDLTVTGSLNVEVDSENTILDAVEVQNTAQLSGQVYANAGITSTTTTSGSFRVTGGVGITENINIGGSITSTAGNLTIGNITAGGNLLSNIGSITAGFNYAYIGNIMPMANAVGNIGSVASQYDVVHARALQAIYADLAEKYVTDQEYEVGTVVAIGGTQEVTAAINGDRAIGAVSANPAYLMNAGGAGQMIALKGRVAVKVQGPISKGDKLVPAQDMAGHASTADNSNHNYFAIALDNNSSDIGVIEALIL